MMTFKHLAVRCRDLGKSRTFYEEGLGFTFVGLRGAGPSMDLSEGHMNLTLLPFETAASLPHAEGDEHMHFGIIVPSLDPIFERLRRIEAHIVKEDVKKRLDYEKETVPIRSFKVLDPDGNVVDISEHLQEWRVSE